MNQSAQAFESHADEGDIRAQLACAFRWTARLNMHEATANHFSAAVSEDGQTFLLNPEGVHFAEMRASDLVRVDHNELEQPVNVDPTAWAIHGAIHRSNPSVRCVLHTHAPYATALACLDDPVLPPIDQNAMRFYEQVVVDAGFNGMGLGEEAERLSQLVEPGTPILLLGNHGLVAFGDSIAQAFDNLYYFERACHTWLTVLATGRPVHWVDSSVARETARQWREYPNFADNHFRALQRMLEREEPEFLN